jgi:hypothetical protein
MHPWRLGRLTCRYRRSIQTWAIRNLSSRTRSFAVPRHNGACYHGCANREIWLVLGEHCGFLDFILDAMSIGEVFPIRCQFRAGCRSIARCQDLEICAEGKATVQTLRKSYKA